MAFSMLQAVRLLVAFLLLTVTSCTALPQNDGLRASSLKTLLSRQLFPSPPSQDPFYKAPLGFESKPAGSILKTRSVTNVLLAEGNIPVVVKDIHQILYRTQDSHGKPIATVTTVLVPVNASTDKHLSYQIAYDQVDFDCSPSYAFETSMSNDTSNLQTELLFIDSAIINGWIVSVSDYEGPQAAFTSGLQAAYGVLDNIRAVLKSGSFTGLLPSAKTVLLGYSGGALASGWAAELKQSYAPELNIVGAAFGGLPAKVTSSIMLVNKGPNAGLFPASFNGLANAYPDFAQAVYNDLVPATAAYFKRPLTECMAYNIGNGGYQYDFQNMDIFSYFKDGQGILSNPTVQKVLNQTTVLGLHGYPQKIPLYVWHSYQDQITYLPDSMALAHKYCNQGASVQFVSYSNGSHPYTGLNGVGKGLHFLGDRLNGVPVSGCSFTALDASYSPDTRSVGYLPPPIAAEVLVLLTFLQATGM